MPRGPKLTDREIAAALKQSSGLASIAATRLGCNSNTIRARMKRNPKLARIAENAREDLVDLGEMSLQRKVMDGEGWATCFVLKTLGKSRGYVEPSRYTLELSGLHGGPIEHDHAITVQHVLAGMAENPDYLEAARSRAIAASDASGRLPTDLDLARPLGLSDFSHPPTPPAPSDQPAPPAPPAPSDPEPSC